MLPLRVREDLLCSTSAHPSCGRNHDADASLPEVSLPQSRIAILPVIAMAEGERWVGRDVRYEFSRSPGVREPGADLSGS
jgi:hypothetical protein